MFALSVRDDLETPLEIGNEPRIIPIPLSPLALQDPSKKKNPLQKSKHKIKWRWKRKCPPRCQTAGSVSPHCHFYLLPPTPTVHSTSSCRPPARGQLAVDRPRQNDRKVLQQRDCQPLQPLADIASIFTENANHQRALRVRFEVISIWSEHGRFP